VNRPPKPSIFDTLELSGKKSVQERLEGGKANSKAKASGREDPGVDGLAAKHGAAMLAANGPRPPPHPVWAANRLKRAAEKADPGVDGLKARPPDPSPRPDAPAKQVKWAKKTAGIPPGVPPPDAPAAPTGKWAKGKWAKKNG
jgi:hypothetical protein